jgi:hypothetical protein
MLWPISFIHFPIKASTADPKHVQLTSDASAQGQSGDAIVKSRRRVNYACIRSKKYAQSI